MSKSKRVKLTRSQKETFPGDVLFAWKEGKQILAAVDSMSYPRKIYSWDKNKIMWNFSHMLSVNHLDILIRRI